MKPQASEWLTRFYRSVLQRLPALVFLLEGEDGGGWRIAYLEGDAEDLFPWAPEKLARHATTLESLGIEEEQGRIATHLRRACEEGRSHCFDTRLRTREGGRWFQVRIGPPQQEEGRSLIHGIAVDISERKEAEEELVSTKNMLESLLDSVEEAVFLIESGKRRIVRACNAKAEEIFGYSSEELQSISTEELHVDRASFLRFAELGEPDLEREGKFETDYRMRRKDGTIIHTHNTVSALDPREGWRGGVVSTVRDITDRVRTETALRERVKELGGLSRLGEIASRKDPSLETILEETARLIPPAWQFPPTTVGRVEHGDHVYESGDFEDCIARMSEDLVVGGEVVGKILVGYTAEHPPAVEGPFLQEERDLLRMLAGRLSDILERENAEQSLRESERKYRLLAENTLDVIWALDEELVFTYVNPAIEELTGYTPEEYVGSRLEDHVTPEVLSILKERMAELEERGPERQGAIVETEILHEDGTAIPVEVHGRMLFDEEARPAGLQGTTRDIRPRLAMETELRQAHKLKAIGTLAGGVAHELNSPIMGIKGYADLIGELAEDGSKVARFAGGIERETERVHRIIEDLLSFARTEEAQDHRLLSVKDVVEHTLSLFRTALRHEGIHLEVDLPEDLPRISGRPQQLRQVFMNLLTNARDALNEAYPQRDPEKRLLLSAAVHRKRWIRTTVEDRGPGIQQARMERLFDPFFTTKPEDEGTGLGLSIAYGIVKDHGGEISVASKPDGPTRFHVDLPIAGPPTE